VSLPWPEILRRCATEHHWTPRQVLEEHTIVQLLVILGIGFEVRRPVSWDRLRERVNRRRLEKGLPPLVPRRSTPR
jgi:hypothetical protein